MTVKDGPLWLRNVDGALSVRSQMILWGNVRDYYLIGHGEDEQLEPLLSCLWLLLSANGYAFMAVHDPVDGIRIEAGDAAARQAAAAYLGVSSDDGGHSGPISLELLASVMRRTVEGPQRGALVLDYASRLTDDPEQLDPDRHAFFGLAEKLSHTAVSRYVADAERHTLFSPVIWVVNREQDLPGWLAAGNESIRSIAVPLPDMDDRRRTAVLLADAFAGHDELDHADREEFIDVFAGSTEGLPTQALFKISRLAQDRGLPVNEVADAVRGYKIGLLDNPWRRDHLRARIADGEQSLGGKVLGQPQAVRKALDILQRSSMGLTGAQAAAKGSRPRGVLFFAGPTGVGKTELAKAITTLVFGDEQAYLRFDMSEYASEHAEARLVGAPPGYVGYSEGGQLTDAVRRRPFALLLFDEIEKAAPRILDKFLQVLEDGRLTDGRGTTVHFSETVIVFTSNLGVQGLSPDAMPYDQLERTVRRSITEHFQRELNRPELLNRMGENIVVFDFISRDIGREILALQIENVRRRVQDEHGVDLVIDAEAERVIEQVCVADLSNGGRGIGNALEVALVNPLGRALFAAPPLRGTTLRVAGVREDQGNYHLELQ